MQNDEKKSFSVRIYLQDGHADGVKVVSKSKWAGRCLVIPRSSLSHEKDRQELKAAGVFLLFSHCAARENQTLFIHAADPVGAQLGEVLNQADSWSDAMTFTCKEDSLSLAQYRYIAKRLFALANNSTKAQLSDTDTPRYKSLPEHDIDAAEIFLAHILSLCPLLGLVAFED